MTIAVKWKGKLVGEIEKGRLTSATKYVPGPLGRVSAERRQTHRLSRPASEDGTEGDSTSVSRATGVFLNQLQSAGFSIEED